MSEQFFDNPILNSPYHYPVKHWELDDSGQPTGQLIDKRRSADFITPVPKPKKRKNTQLQLLDSQQGFTDDQGNQYDPTKFIKEVREQVDKWRTLPESQWQVTPETARLLNHWRTYDFEGIKPFFCQLEAVETAIWLAEVAPQMGKTGQRFLNTIKWANEEANPALLRVALKLATGAGKTMVMAMIIAWQTINKVRYKNSQKFCKGFLIITPGITIRDRLRVLLPSDPYNYYKSRNLVPTDLLPEIQQAKVVITNYHAFKLRERISLSSGTRKALQGRGPELNTLETEGQMIQRVMPDLMGLKNILVINDEAHHCYREKPNNEDIAEMDAEEKREAQKENEAARLWINGIEMVKRKLGVNTLYDLSATPFFLQGSGYVEGTLFPWVVSDFSLMDAIECGIVKLPRVPVSDNMADSSEMPQLRNLWVNLRGKMPKLGRGKASVAYDPQKLPPLLHTALDALYGHYQKTFEQWQSADIDVPPVFIIVCNNTSTSKLVYDLISGFHRETKDHDQSAPSFVPAKLPLFSNYDEYGNRLATPRTLLIDSQQLESGDALDEDFREISELLIEQYRREQVERTGQQIAVEKIPDSELLREVMNTVGKKGRLGGGIRCVVSVSMLTEGWDANTVTHVLGVRAFGTQLLCEQVVGRALRRQSYELNEQGLFDVEYADVLGIPFDFTAKPVVVKPKKPSRTVTVKAINPERTHLELQFPRVEGYRIEPQSEQLQATFAEDSRLILTPQLLGPTITSNQGIVGESANLTLEHLDDMRQSTLYWELAAHLLVNQYRDANEDVKYHLVGQLKRIVRQWVQQGYLVCEGGTFPAQVLYPTILDMAAERIKHAINQTMVGNSPVKAILDPYNPIGSTQHVHFNTSKETLWQTDPRKSHINWVVCDSNWEAEFARVAEAHPHVKSYVKNQGLGLEIPYQYQGEKRHYLPDFIVQVDDGRDDLLSVIVEIKGMRGEAEKDKANTVRDYWVQGVNHLQKFGRWEFIELREPFKMQEEFDQLIRRFRNGE